MNKQNSEIWRHVPILKEHQLEASNLGSIRSGNKILHQYFDCGYLNITLKIADKQKRLRSHRIICISFHSIPENLEQSTQYNFIDGIPYIVNHKNGIKIDNRSENLEWSTQLHNVNHSHDNDLTSPNIKFIIFDVIEKRDLYFRSLHLISQFLKVHPANVYYLATLHGNKPYKDRYLIEIINKENLGNFKKKSDVDMVVKNYKTHTVTIYKNFTEACVKNEIKPTIVIEYFNVGLKRNGEKLINGLLFRKLDDLLIEWPIFSTNDLDLSIQKWKKFITRKS